MTKVSVNCFHTSLHSMRIPQTKKIMSDMFVKVNRNQSFSILHLCHLSELRFACLFGSRFAQSLYPNPQNVYTGLTAFTCKMMKKRNWIVRNIQITTVFLYKIIQIYMALCGWPFFFWKMGWKSNKTERFLYCEKVQFEIKNGNCQREKVNVWKCWQILRRGVIFRQLFGILI